MYRESFLVPRDISLAQLVDAADCGRCDGLAAEIFSNLFKMAHRSGPFGDGGLSDSAHDFQVGRQQNDNEDGSIVRQARAWRGPR